MTTLPAEVDSQLAQVGGITGLMRRLPGQDALAAASLVHHALSEPLRLKIAHALAVQPLCVCVIKDIVGIADSKLSYHLNQLKKADLIVGEQQGSWIIYRLTPRGERCMAMGYPPLEQESGVRLSPPRREKRRPRSRSLPQESDRIRQD